MRKNKKILCLLLAVTSLYMSAPVQAVDNLGTDKNIKSVEAVKTEFAEDRVIVVLNKEASLKFDTYDHKDFSDVGCTKVTDLSADMGKLVKEKIEKTQTAEKAAAYEKTASNFNRELDVNSYKQILCLELSAPGKENVYKTIKILSQRSDVYSVSPDYYVYAETVTATSDPYYDDQWGLTACNFPSAWNLATSTNTVMVAVIDSGIDGETGSCHPDLTNRIASYYNRTCIDEIATGGLYDGYGHGTHVAGIIAANYNNNLGICGAVGDNSIRLVSLQISDNTGRGAASDMIRAISYAATLEIPVVNISVGYMIYNGYDESGGYFNVQNDQNGLYSIMNIYPGLFVCAAGNNNQNTDSTSYNHYPSEFNLGNIISVGAMTESKAKASSSNYGTSSVDIFAPGQNILSCFSSELCELGACGYNHTNNEFEKYYHSLSGTSMATPFVTAVAAMLKAQYPSFTPAQIKARILNNATQKSGLSCVSGGYLNAKAAMQG